MNLTSPVSSLNIGSSVNSTAVSNLESDISLTPETVAAISNADSPYSLLFILATTEAGIFQAQCPVYFSVSTKVPSSLTSTLVKVTLPSSTSTSSSKAVNILSAPARAANIIFTCWDTCAIGFETCFVYCKYDTNDPISKPPAIVIKPPIQQVTA